MGHKEETQRGGGGEMDWLGGDAEMHKGGGQRKTQGGDDFMMPLCSIVYYLYSV